MAWNFRKAIRLPFGFRLNLSKNGISWSWGVPGARWSFGRRGTTRTISVPSTGIFNRKTTGRRPK